MWPGGMNNEAEGLLKDVAGGHGMQEVKNKPKTGLAWSVMIMVLSTRK